MYGFHQAFRALAAVAVTGFFAVAGIAAPASAVAMPVTIDFETDGNGAALAPGATIAGNEWANLGISLSSSGGALRLFNSSCGPGFGTTCTGGDGDLGSGFDFGQGFVPAQGNVLIRQFLPHTGAPDDTAAAGTIRFDFDRHVRLISIALLDNDNDDGITLNIFRNNEAAPSTTILRPSVNFDNFFETFLFAGDATWVTRLDVVFPSSGAIATLTISPVPLPAALPLLLSALAWLGWAARRRRRVVV